MRWATGLIAIAGLAGSAAALSPPTPAPTPQAAACADADGDGVLTVTDGVQALRAAAGLASSCTLFRCDVDGNGAVTVTDGVGILARAVGLHLSEFYDCPVPTTIRDFSGFTSFRLSRQSGLGFCPPVDSVLGAQIERQSDGTFLMRSSFTAERSAGDEDCIEPGFFASGVETCLAQVHRPDRILTSSELERLRASFSAIETSEAPLPLCEIVEADPCLVDRFSWDEFCVFDEECNGRWIRNVTSLIEVLDGLIVPATP